MEDQDKEEGPLARDIEPPFPARPGSRTILATTAEYGRWKLCRVGLTLRDAIEEEVGDYLHGRRNFAPAEFDEYARTSPDVALWEGERCLAVVRPRVGGDPEVTRFDGVEEDRPLPMPSTEAERIAWSLIKQYGAERCRKAILAECSPGFGPRPESSRPLTEAESIAVRIVRDFGEQLAMDRLLLAGPYGEIARVIDRLGTDAVAELRRIIAAGKAE